MSNMTDNIRQPIIDAGSLSEAFRVILQTTEPSLVLQVLDSKDAVVGEFWVKNGREVTAAACRKSGKTGYKGLIELLELRGVRFQLDSSDPKPAGESIKIEVETLAADPAKAISRIKEMMLHLSDSAATEANASAGMNSKEKPHDEEKSSDKKDSTLNDSALKEFEAPSKIPIVPEVDQMAERIKSELAAAPSKTVSEAEQLLDEQMKELLMAVDDLDPRRKSELETAKEYFADPPEVFHQKTEKVTPDVDDQVSQRLDQYERLKQDGSKAEAFHEKPAVQLIKDDSGTLDDYKKSILELVESEYSDPQQFEETNPLLSDETSLKPNWEAPPGTSEEPGLPNVLSKNSQVTLRNIPVSPYEGTIDLLAKDPNPNDLGLERRADDLTIIQRDSIAGHHIVGVERQPTGLATIPPHIRYASICILVALPLVTMLCVVRANYSKSIELEDAAMAASQMDKSMDKESAAVQAQQPFRMPAGQTGPSGGAGGRGGPADVAGFAGKEDGTIDLSSIKYHPPANPLPALTAAQLNDASASLATGEKLMLSGKQQEAARLYLIELSKYPQHGRLRIAAIAVYLQLRDYATAKSLCLDGIKNASSPSDFLLFFNMLKSIPGVQRAQ